MHRSTVYRTLETSEEVNLVQHVHLGHSPSTYHLADEPHHHAVCETCGTVIHLPADTFPGRCEACRTAAATLS